LFNELKFSFVGMVFWHRCLNLTFGKRFPENAVTLFPATE